MAATALLSLIPMAIDLLGGVLGKSESDQLAEEMRKNKAEIPEFVTQALSEAERGAQRGIPGRALYEERSRELMGQSLAMQKETSQSPSTMITMAGEAMNATNRRYQDIMVADAAEKRRNQERYQNMLMGAGAMDIGIQQQNIEMEYAASLQEAQGTKDLLAGINRGIGTGIDTYATIKGLEYQKQQGEMMKGFFDDPKRLTTPGTQQDDTQVAPTPFSLTSPNIMRDKQTTDPLSLFGLTSADDSLADNIDFNSPQYRAEDTFALLRSLGVIK